MSCARQVGDAGQIHDVMAVMLESISSIPVMARNTITTVYRTAQIAASLPNLSYQNKVSFFFFFLLPSFGFVILILPTF